MSDAFPAKSVRELILPLSSYIFSRLMSRSESPCNASKPRKEIPLLCQRVLRVHRHNRLPAVKGVLRISELALNNCAMIAALGMDPVSGLVREFCADEMKYSLG
jgi:hypothetical protein